MFSPLNLSGLLLTYCESTSLVVWGDILPSNVGAPRFWLLKIVRWSIVPIHIKGILYWFNF